jgi:hypothetical protein
VRALVLGDEHAGHLALHGRDDEHRPGSAVLRTSGDVWRIAELRRQRRDDGARVARVETGADQIAPPG